MRRQSRLPGFTLVELMISIAIALLLVLGVNTIFRITSQAVGAGESVLSSARDARTVLQTLLADLTCVDPCPYGGSGIGDAPCFIIRSEQINAYRNANDFQNATDQTNAYHDDNLFANLNSGHLDPVTFTNTRSNRIDRLGFFAKQGSFARQTSSNPATYVAPSLNNNGQVETGSVAWVLYGQSQQPNNTVINGVNNTDWADPGAGSNSTNNHNFYASDWMLTRVALILNQTPPSSSIYNYIQDTGSGLSPLAQGSASKNDNTLLLQSGALDVAGPTALASWNSSARTNGIGTYGYNPVNGNPLGNNGQNWWDPLINYRFQVGPYMLYPVGTTSTSQKPKMNPYGMGKCAPNLIRGCSQFIVEFAGSYYTKNPVDGSAAPFLSNGQPQTIPTPDGQLDFVIVNGVRQVRWYGFPRSVIAPALQGGYFSSPINPNAGDVVPLRDVLSYLSGQMSPPQPMWVPYCTGTAWAERFSGNFPTASSGAYTNYASVSTMNPSTDQKTVINSSSTSNYTYTAAWGPDVKNTPFPKLIRIIIGIDDHEGRLNAPQLYEFVYQLQP